MARTRKPQARRRQLAFTPPAPWLQPKYWISTEIIVDRNATAARVMLCNSNGGQELITATGSAKREQGDRHDECIARNKALGRALVTLGQGLIDDSDRAVRLATEEQQAARIRRAVKVQRALRLEADITPPLTEREVLEAFGPEAAKVHREREQKANPAPGRRAGKGPSQG